MWILSAIAACAVGVAVWASMGWRNQDSGTEPQLQSSDSSARETQPHHDTNAESLQRERSAAETIALQPEREPDVLDATSEQAPDPIDELLSQLGMTWSAYGLDACLRTLEERLQDDPNDAELWYTHGRALGLRASFEPPGIERDKYGDAIKRSFRRALELNPQYWQVHYTLASSWRFWPIAEGRLVESIEEAEKALQIMKTSPKEEHNFRAYVLLGDLYIQNGQKQRAAEILREGVKCFPEQKELRAMLRRLQ